MKKLIFLSFLIPLLSFAGGPTTNQIPDYIGEKLDSRYSEQELSIGQPYPSTTFTGTLSNDIESHIIKKGNGNSVVKSKAGKESQEYNQINEIVYSRDGTHIAYSAFRGLKNVLVIDGIESREYDGYISELRFLEDNKSVSFILSENTISENDGPKLKYITYSYIGENGGITTVSSEVGIKPIEKVDNLFIRFLKAIVSFLHNLF